MADSTTQSQGQSSSRSSSEPVVINTPQSDWALQLSKLLGALTQNQYTWALDQYNKGMGVTDQNVAQYMQLAGQGAGLAQNLLGRYENVFEPLMNKYIEQAGAYNSEARQRFMMGQAESTAGQADQAAMDSAQRQLQGYGVNPNSGRYEDLLQTSRLQDAATRAGAGTQASLNTAAIGRQMTQQAAQFGQNLPGMTVNALQSAYTGLGGAENAVLGQLNTGANLLNTVPNFGNAAANANKNPLTGQQSNSQGGSQQSSQGKGNQQQPKQPTDGSSGKGSQTPPWDPVANANATRNKGDLPDIPGAGTQNKEDQNQDNTPAGVLPDWLTSLNNDPSLARGDPFGLGSPDQATSPDNTNWPSATFSDGLQFPAGTGQGAGTNPNGVSSNVDQFNMGSFPQDQGGQQQSSGNDNPWTSNQFGQDSSGNWGGGDFSNSDLAAQAGINDIGSGFNGGDYTPPPSDTGDPNGGFSGGDYSGGGFSGGDYSGGYAAGGVIPNRTTGGPVPRNASPSGGRQTDDIPARLNANEFVIPRDVKEHMGTKYFTDLIAKSRKARTGMAGPPPRGKMKPALRMRPTFTSNYMGNR